MSEPVSVKDARVFISGPMTGKPDWNRAAFSECESMLRFLGAKAVYNPAKDAPMSDKSARSHEAYMLGSIHELTAVHSRGRGATRAARFYDVLVLLPGWVESEGACEHVTVAEAIGMEVVEWTELTSKSE